MAEPKPIDTAPKDGRKVTVLWTDRDGQEKRIEPHSWKPLTSGDEEE
jgi:hypothetical protein